MGYRINSALASCDPTPKAKEACSVAACVKPARWKKLCSAHYERLRVHGSTDDRSTHEDLSGRLFGRLTAVELGPKAGRKTVWRCVCQCGKETLVQAGNLKSGHTQSCGCFTSHGLSNTGAYISWVAMRQRCNNENSSDFHNYGGRGITVCPEWQDSFETFYADMGERPPGRTLDRKNNELGYSPDNCRWATAVEQANNKRKSTRKTLKDICREHGISVHTVASRIKNQGMTLEQALSAPVRGRPSDAICS